MEQVDKERSEITLTEAAIQRVRNIIAEGDLANHALRVFVSGGGCSGLQYGMALEKDPRDSDIRITNHGIDVVIDPMSMNYLTGATIDYVDDLMGGGFRIENPNAIASCGCGNSFRTAENAPAEASDGSCNCS